MADVSLTLKEQFEKRTNTFLKGSCDISLNEYGAVFKLPHTNKIATWKKRKRNQNSLHALL